jgi:hypothetical protein
VVPLGFPEIFVKNKVHARIFSLGTLVLTVIPKGT